MEKIVAGDIITFVDENDQEREIEVFETLSLEGTDYAAAGFVEDIQENTTEKINVFFVKIEDDEQFSVIEDEEEFRKISAAFEES
ncbi:DUF1292 domain-containing protein [Domibacillus sp. DTU_2020_1001157_1_SI_ALB_TIR_016]|uniref:DUF1292 domain-containing protein n=1 Tax=Domibacillus sp. DTU_2020_1001157_1_SI_ALB_TIR_016 TaxID=3077789 RepID=UPI0028ED7D7A|nr:DUF1292 domain-containing protein [Domibacillus sp. DTU_2020_1001157_1_SI_ALB_TIR_016]WNS77863.1 DUF1292 domain-containing protein [Domibacillus sp. DTU_2020_1001157_1_SI_ALB_TIR_016]